MSGLPSRQPSRVSATPASRGNGSAARGSTNGARVIDSAPPASMTSASPAAMARAALAMASIPDPQSRVPVARGPSTGRPASSTPIRATFRLSSPAWLAAPQYTSSIRAGSSHSLRASRALITSAVRWSGRTEASEPLLLPTGVRHASTANTAVMSATLPSARVAEVPSRLPAQRTDIRIAHLTNGWRRRSAPDLDEQDPAVDQPGRGGDSHGGGEPVQPARAGGDRGHGPREGQQSGQGRRGEMRDAPAERVFPFQLPSRDVPGHEHDDSCGEDRLADAEARVRQAGNLDKQAPGQCVGEERQRLDGPVGQRLALEDRIEVEGDGHEGQAEQGPRRGGERGAEVVPLARVVSRRHWSPPGSRAQRTGAPRLAARAAGAQGAWTLSRMAGALPASASAAW